MALALPQPVADPVDDQRIFLGRQSILNRDQNLVAFELLFRSSKQNSALITDDESATINVINRAFTDIGLENTIGKYKGFINDHFQHRTQSQLSLAAVVVTSGGIIWWFIHAKLSRPKTQT